jgi:hypothetical protein
MAKSCYEIRHLIGFAATNLAGNAIALQDDLKPLRQRRRVR